VISRPLTERQKAILDFIVETVQTRGFPPTLREIGRAFSIRSTKGVNDHLAALERKGKIRRHADLSRGIEVVDLPGFLEDADSVPLLGRIAAGAPLLATENVEDTFCIDRGLTRGGEFMLVVQGDSMIEDHICDGDLILVRRQDAAQDGEIVAVLVDDEATVKRFYREGKAIRLEPANAAMQPIHIDASSTDVRILGKVVGVFRSL
jgi:repressor LexA